MNPTKIEWTEKVWNPSIGCDKVSLTDNRSKDASGTLELEREIDQLVYNLYNLTEEEIKIIEGGK